MATWSGWKQTFRDSVLTYTCPLSPFAEDGSFSRPIAGHRSVVTWHPFVGFRTHGDKTQTRAYNNREAKQHQIWSSHDSIVFKGHERRHTMTTHHGRSLCIFRSPLVSLSLSRSCFRSHPTLSQKSSIFGSFFLELWVSEATQRLGRKPNRDLSLGERGFRAQ